MQTPDDYVSQVSGRTTGLPHVLARRNMQGKIHKMMAEMRTVLAATHAEPGSGMVLDRGFGTVDGQELSFFPRGNSLSVIFAPVIRPACIPCGFQLSR